VCEDEPVEEIIRRRRGRVKKNRVSSAGGGGYCCDHCSDSKFPCVFIENKMRKASGKAEAEEKEGAEKQD